MFWKNCFFTLPFVTVYKRKANYSAVGLYRLSCNHQNCLIPTTGTEKLKKKIHRRHLRLSWFIESFDAFAIPRRLQVLSLIVFSKSMVYKLGV